MIIDGFTMLRRLSGGRHGEIWQAADDTSGAAVALKQLLGADPATAVRIRAEVDRLSALSEPHLVRSRPPVSDPNDMWLVEDWVEGTSLAAIMAGSADLSRPQALGVVRGVLIGLAAAHRAGVAHGEVSPRSIMITIGGQIVVVGFAAHLAEDSVAGADGFASPETAAGAAAAPTADVYATGTILARLLPAGGTELRPVVDRAMTTEAGGRYPDADAFLADLDAAAERAYGAGWWTTAGLSAVVAATVAATSAGAAGAGVAAAGSAGTISGSLTAGEGALAGASQIAPGAGAVKTVATAGRSGRRVGLILAGAVVVLIAVVVGAVALLRPGSSGAAPNGAQAADTNTGRATSSAPVTSPSPSPSTRPTPTPIPKPTPPAPPQQGFGGSYRYEAVVTKSTDSNPPVGKRYTATWVVQSTCRGTSCSATVRSSTQQTPFTMPSRGKGWHTDQTIKTDCVFPDTGKRTGQRVPLRYVRTLEPGSAGASGVTKITGRESVRQMKMCTRQTAPRYEVRYKITISKIK